MRWCMSITVTERRAGKGTNIVSISNPIPIAAIVATATVALARHELESTFDDVGFRRLESE